MSNSITGTLQTLINLNGSMRTARDIGQLQNPLSAHNTTIRNIHFIRSEFGNAVILDDSGKNAKYSLEKRYWLNPDFEFKGNFFYQNIGEKTRDTLTEMIIHPVINHQFIPIEKKKMNLFQKSLRVISVLSSLEKNIISAYNDSTCAYSF